MGADRDHVVLRNKENDLEIFGELEMDGEGCRVAGIVPRLTRDNYFQFRPEELHGVSTSRGSIWLERVSISSSVYGNGPRPSTVNLAAFTAYWGDFDPRATPIQRISLPLHDLLQLSDVELTNRSICHEDRTHVSRSKIQPPSTVLLETGEFTIAIEYLSTIGDDVTYRQALFITFKVPVAYHRATMLIDTVVALIFLLTDSIMSTSTKTFYTDTHQMAHQWKAGGTDRRIEDWRDWLEPPGKIVELLRKMLASWLREIPDEREVLRINKFFAAANPSVYIETGFLSYCQCFEDLTRRRRPMRAMEKGHFDQSVLAPLKVVITTLKAAGTIDKDLAGRLSWSIKQANDIPLKLRLAGAFESEPWWRKHLREYVSDIFERVESRRNNLSHGNPLGSILNQNEANAVHLEREFMFLHCVGEILFLGGLAEGEVNKLVQKSKTVSHIQWLAAKLHPRS